MLQKGFKDGPMAWRIRLSSAQPWSDRLLIEAKQLFGLEFVREGIEGPFILISAEKSGESSAEPWFDRSLIEAKQVFRLEFFDRDETGVNAILEIRFYILRLLLNK